MTQPILYMMFGYPGAGKTTTAKVIHELTGAEHLSSDELRIKLFPHPTYDQKEHDMLYATLDKNTEALLKAGKSVIYDANLNRYKHRQEKYELCKRTGARPVLLWVQTPRELARQRAVMRGHHHLLPKDETFESLFDRVTSVIEEPDHNEPVRKIEGANLDRDALAETLAKA